MREQNGPDERKSTFEKKARLAVHPTVGLVILDDDRIQIIGFGEAFTVDDRQKHVRTLLDWCDGRRTETEILELLNNRLENGKQLLEFMKSRQYITSVGPTRSDLLLDYLDVFSRSVASLRPDRVRETDERLVCVVIVGSGELANAASNVLGALGCKVRHRSADEESEICDLQLALSDAVDHGWCRAVNRRAYSCGQPVLFGALDGHSVRIGPLTVPRESACFECYHHRLRSHAEFRREFDARILGYDRPGDTGSPPLLAAQAGAVLAAAAAMGFIVEHVSLGRPNQIVEQDLLANRITTHTLMKLPRCPVCGPAKSDSVQTAIYAPFGFRA
jgi:bacteriocin biosynthesis cyclodehydratase domain-containing protein